LALPSYLAATSWRYHRSSVSGDQCFELKQGLGGTRKSPPLRVGEAKAPLAELLSKSEVLGLQVDDDVTLVAAQPAGQGEHEKAKSECHDVAPPSLPLRHHTMLNIRMRPFMTTLERSASTPPSSSAMVS